ncbi:MAG: tRNA preQ1(34) S-adenosylmethionine ribosyltransferase-isomerase QueA [Desulfomonile tiedjei]|nr:tRNA preQ1(34) S-adenosylmethionine ribosyltransferase-isomerase QueA [Desulfomonile tiedjei]
MSEEILLQPGKTERAGDRSIPDAFRLATYRYDLPPELIAQEPAAVRDQSRLLAIRRASGSIERYAFHDLPSLLRPSDLLVMNETRVVPAALTCKKPTGGRVDLLVMEPVAGIFSEASTEPVLRTCLVRSSKRLVPGAVLAVEDGPLLRVECVTAPGRAIVRFPVEEAHFLEFLDAYGLPPLPPYIRHEGRDAAEGRSRYQTVYARTPGSIAAPTAGLHFTEELLEHIEEKGIECVRIVLHVGPGTFIPVRQEDIRLHSMQPEFYEIPEIAAEKIPQAKRDNRRIIAVGTTTVRTLESAALASGSLKAGTGKTDLFIYPGYPFRVIDGLVTNFHLPGSTLLMLVAALGGTDLVLRAYQEAVKSRFRFYSYGDACIII